MNIELEAKFVDLDHNDIRNKLIKLGAVNAHPRRLMKRNILDFPDNRLEKDKSWIRVRDEGDKITWTYKRDVDKSFGSVEEIETTVGSLEDTNLLLNKLGLVSKSYQESYRETWTIGEVHIELDEWPFIPPFIEIEGNNEESIKEIASKLDLTWEDAVFGSVTTVYKIKYPNMVKKGRISDIKELKFNSDLPDILKED